MTQGERSLLQFEMAQIFENDIRHRHAKGCGKILLGHGALLGRIGKEANETGGQILGVAGLVKLNGHPFPVGHLAKILKIGAHDGNAVSAGQMRNSAATC